MLTVDNSMSVLQMPAFTLSDAGNTMIHTLGGRGECAKQTGRVKLVVMLTKEPRETSKLAGEAAGATSWIVRPLIRQRMPVVVKRVIG